MSDASGRRAILDACVLCNYSLCDSLLRLAEVPGLYEPRWSDEILAETLRTLTNKLDWPEHLARYFESQLKQHFVDAWVNGYEQLVPAMTNDSNDRHVAAAAVHCQASTIVTYNLKHFNPEHLAHYGVCAEHPQTFLITLCRKEPEAVLATLKRQATDRHRTLDQLLSILKRTVPEFVDYLPLHKP